MPHFFKPSRAATTLVLSAAALASHAADWLPTQSLNFVIPVAAGGTVDLYARGIKAVAESHKLLNGQSMLLENKGGAGGAIALRELTRNPGNAHHLSTFHTGFLAGAVTGAIKMDIRELTPVAMLVEEVTVVAVPASSPIKTGMDLVNALKRDPTSLRIAVAPALGQNIHLAIAKPLKVAGVDVKQLTVAPFRSSGESVTALLGSHVDVVSATAPVLLPHLESGKLRAIAVATKERGGGVLANVPTWREQGVPADYVSYSGVFLPPGLNADKIRYWEDTLRKVSQSKEWIALVERAGGRPIFRGYVESHRYMLSEWQATKELAATLGLETF